LNDGTKKTEKEPGVNSRADILIPNKIKKHFFASVNINFK